VPVKPAPHNVKLRGFGVTVTVPPRGAPQFALTVTVDVNDLLGSATEVAVTEYVPVAETVRTPDELMLPPDVVQVTACEALAGLTVALNGIVMF
jgi:hypothetical protein